MIKVSVCRYNYRDSGTFLHDNPWVGPQTFDGPCVAESFHCTGLLFRFEDVLLGADENRVLKCQNAITISSTFQLLSLLVTRSQHPSQALEPDTSAVHKVLLGKSKDQIVSLADPMEHNIAKFTVFLGSIFDTFGHLFDPWSSWLTSSSLLQS